MAKEEEKTLPNTARARDTRENESRRAGSEDDEKAKVEKEEGGSGVDKYAL